MVIQTSQHAPQRGPCGDNLTREPFLADQSLGQVLSTTPEQYKKRKHKNDAVQKMQTK